MRTVTFSNPKVADRVNSRFVPVWYNRGKGFHNCEKRTEEWIFNSSAECYPTKNICTFFLTPDMRVVYYVAGYYAPDVFLEILDAVEKVQGAQGADDFSRLHREIGAQLSVRLDQLKTGKGGGKEGAAADPGPLAAYGPCRYEKSEHRHGPPCLGVVAEALRYRKEVHDTLAGDGAVGFDRVQHSYKFGNPFTEEAHASPGVEFSKPLVPARPAPAARKP